MGTVGRRYTRKNYDGMRFNHIVVVRRDHRDERGEYWFLCRCDCGTEFLLRQGSLKHKKSCGCMRQEMNRMQATRHGGKYERLYKVWDGIKYRCNNPNSPEYENYGGRGIKVCDEWKTDYAAFRKWAMENGYDPNAPKMKCTIDRIDVNGNYEPNNCRWGDERLQSNNRRKNKRLTIKGETHTVAEWSRISGVGSKTILYRLKTGWIPEDAIFTPPDRNNRREDHAAKD